MLQYKTGSEQETAAAAYAICKRLPPGSVVAFTGGMGMGKTAFVRGALKAFGNDAFVSSPTFALVHDYGGDPPVYHFDMYRVQGEDDLYSTGFFDYLDGRSILFIEWSENIAGALPPDTVFVHIAPGEKENDRVITVEGGVFSC